MSWITENLYRYDTVVFIYLVHLFIFIYFVLDSLSTLPSYGIPQDCSQSSCAKFISNLPATEHPEVFGQHPNADIASQFAETRTLFDTLLSLQPQVISPSAAGSGLSQEERVSPGCTLLAVKSLLFNMDYFVYR